MLKIGIAQISPARTCMTTMYARHHTIAMKPPKPGRRTGTSTNDDPEGDAGRSANSWLMENTW